MLDNSDKAATASELGLSHAPGGLPHQIFGVEMGRARHGMPVFWEGADTGSLIGVNRVANIASAFASTPASEMGRVGSAAPRSIRLSCTGAAGLLQAGTVAMALPRGSDGGDGLGYWCFGWDTTSHA